MCNSFYIKPLQLAFEGARVVSYFSEKFKKCFQVKENDRKQMFGKDWVNFYEQSISSRNLVQNGLNNVKKSS